MDKQFTYGFLREEMIGLTTRQDTLLSIAYAATLGLWTVALTISNDWVAIIPTILLIPFSLKTYDLRYGATFIAAYIKICLEEQSYSGWETIRDKYYEQGFGKAFKSSNSLSKLSYLLLTLGSCIVFWVLRIVVLNVPFMTFTNGCVFVVQLMILIFQIIMYYMFSSTNQLKKRLEANWTLMKEKYIDKGNAK